MTTEQCALAFVLGTHAKCHNASTDGQEYLLNGSRIAWREPDNSLWVSFVGYHTKTTYNHLKAICKAAGSTPPNKINYTGPDPWKL